LDANPVPSDKQSLGHSLRYLADKARNKEEDQKKRKAYAIQLESEASDRLKRMKYDDEGKKQWILDQKLKELTKWCGDLEKGTDDLYKQMHGDNWKEMRAMDLNRLAVLQEEASKRQKEIEAYQKERRQEKDIKITGFKWIWCGTSQQHGDSRCSGRLYNMERLLLGECEVVLKGYDRYQHWIQFDSDKGAGTNVPIACTFACE